MVCACEDDIVVPTQNMSLVSSVGNTCVQQGGMQAFYLSRFNLEGEAIQHWGFRAGWVGEGDSVQLQAASKVCWLQCAMRRNGRPLLHQLHHLICRPHCSCQRAEHITQ